MTTNYLPRPLLILLFFLWQTACAPSEQEQGKQPNIVFFLIDDLGYSDLGCYGSDYYETPNIDRLAADGMLFTQNYAAAMVCSPTRASIVTGKYPGRLHITHAIPIRGSARLKNTKLLDADYSNNLPLEEVTIAEAFKEAGYATAAIGKWHLAMDSAGYPTRQGFDVNIGGNNMGNPGEYFCPYQGSWQMTKDSPLYEWNVLPDCTEGEYLTDRLTDEAIGFIEQHRDDPFFVYLQHYAVHTPIQAKEDIAEKYRSKLADTLKGHANAEYAAMIESVDRGVGKILERLDMLGLTDRTIVVLTSDNGGYGRVTSNWPWRGNKGNFYEGGIRVPLIVQWPGHIPSGEKSDLRVISTDYYPTLLELSGLPLKPDQHLDGVSFAGQMTTGMDEMWSGSARNLFWHFPNYIGAGHPDGAYPCSVVRSGNWKLIQRFEDWSVELYDLKSDSLETSDLSGDMPDKVAELTSILDKWRDAVQAQMPVVNPEYRSEKQ